jgi:hypothetical protein
MSDRIDREFDEIDEGLAILLREIGRLASAIECLVQELRRARSSSPPSACMLAGTFTSGAPDMSSAILQATIPSTRQDGSALLASAIASITYQKVPAGAPAGSQPTVLQTNSEPVGSGLSPADLSFTDSSASVGDSYTAFVTDSAGNVGAVSSAFVAAASGGGGGTGPLAPPSAPTLSGTFTA